MSRQTQGSMLLIGVLSGAIALVAFLVLLVIGEYTFSPAAFLALLVGLAVAIFLFRAVHTKVEPPEATRRATEAALHDVEKLEGRPATARATGIAGAAVSAGEGHGETGAQSHAPAAEPAAESPPAPEPSPAPEPASAPSAEASAPEKLDAPRGEPDDLKKIKGVGPKLEALLHRMGFYHYDQIANWTAGEVAWVDENLEGFKGRVSRDDWVAQAKVLAEGGETEFSKKVDEGDVY